jgi:type I restriction enzyme R subunit
VISPKPRRFSREDINDDIVFEIELIKQVEVNIDYILMLVAKYHDTNCKDKNILVTIDKAIGSSLQLRSKKELIKAFIDKVNVATNVDDDWHRFVSDQKEKELATIISDERLKDKATRKFIDNSFRSGELRTTGTDIDRIMPPISRFGSNNRNTKKQTVIERLTAFFEKFLGII